MTTGIIIVNYKNPWYLNLCLESIFKHTQDFHILLVHQAPETDSIQVGEKYKKLYPEQITIKINEKNLGYVGGINTMYQEAMNFERVCLLNPDCIVTKGWLAEMNKTFDENGDVVQVSPDSNQYYKESLPWRLVRWQIKSRFPKTGDKIYKNMIYFNPPKTSESFNFKDTGDQFYLFCGGFCNLIRTKYFKTLGYILDPQIVHGYGDDFDLSYYLRQFGKIGSVNKSYVFHFVNAALNQHKSSSAELKEKIKYLNQMYIFNKWRDGLTKDMNQIGQERLLHLAQHHPEVKFMLTYFGLIKVNPSLIDYFGEAPANTLRAQFLK